jgi:hypothetical protein
MGAKNNNLIKQRYQSGPLFCLVRKSLYSWELLILSILYNCYFVRFRVYIDYAEICQMHWQISKRIKEDVLYNDRAEYGKQIVKNYQTN